VAHYPAGASKYNPIERRLFSQISKNWAAEPLTGYDKILGLIRQTTTTTGLRVRAYLDTKDYPLKVKPSAKGTGTPNHPPHDPPKVELHHSSVQCELILAPVLSGIGLQRAAANFNSRVFAG
jgi:hypothetical protein